MWLGVVLGLWLGVFVDLGVCVGLGWFLICIVNNDVGRDVGCKVLVVRLLFCLVWDCLGVCWLFLLVVMLLGFCVRCWGVCCVVVVMVIVYCGFCCFLVVVRVLCWVCWGLFLGLGRCDCGLVGGWLVLLLVVFGDWFVVVIWWGRWWMFGLVFVVSCVLFIGWVGVVGCGVLLVVVLFGCCGYCGFCWLVVWGLDLLFGFWLVVE